MSVEKFDITPRSGDNYNFLDLEAPPDDQSSNTSFVTIYVLLFRSIKYL